jgi:hypothetical protein
VLASLTLHVDVLLHGRVLPECFREIREAPDRLAYLGMIDPCGLADASRLGEVHRRRIGFR